MMTEVLSDQPEIVSANPDVVTQLHEAAQTDVTNSSNGSPRKAPPTAGFMPQPAHMMGTPGAGDRAAFHGSPVNPPTPQMYTPFASPQMYQSPMPQGAPIVRGLVNQSPVTTPAPYYSAPAAMQSPYEACAAIQMDDVGGGGSVQSPLANDFGGGLFGWGKGFMSKIAEKTKSSVETMITTLDPQMKQVIYSGGDLTVIVTSSREAKIAPVRDAFLSQFGRATVEGQECQANTAPQPVGFTAGCKGAEDRIQHLRSSGVCVGHEVIVSIEGFIVEILPDRWFEMSCLLLRDATNNVDVQTFSQPTPLPAAAVAYMQDSTPPDYPMRWSGLAVTAGEAMERVVGNMDRSRWHELAVGVSRSETLALAARTLVGLYKGRLHPSVYANT